MQPTRARSATVLLTAVLIAGCGSLGRREAPNAVVPEGSEWAAPAAELRSRHYDIAEVDTIIGFVRGVRTWSDGTGTLTDELTVEIYRDGTTNRRVKRVTLQTHRVRRDGSSVLEEDLGATWPSSDARRDAEELLAELGCQHPEVDQRMTLEGPVFQAWCSEDGTEHGAAERQSGRAAGRLNTNAPLAIRHTLYALHRP